jgi:hypothetical protein
MANDKKFLVKNGLTTQNISFVDNTQSTNNTIDVSMLTTDTLSFTGASGQLFSITDSMSGTIFAVNDISGIPAIEVDDDGTIRLAETFGNVLVGTAVDDGTNKLQVAGNVSISSAISAATFAAANGSVTSPSFNFTADTNTGMYLVGADTLGFVSNGSARMCITSSGNVGIGTETPASALDVLGSIRVSTQFVSTITTGTAPFSVQSTTRVSNLNVATAGTADTASSVTNALTFNNSGSGAASGSTFNGGTAVTVSHNTIGASPVAGSASLTTLGTVTTGTWNAGVIAGQYGGTGVNNTGRTITLGGNVTTANTFTTSGNFALTLTQTAATNVTLPTTGTLATTGNLSQFAATTSSQLAGVISDETGSGALVFGTSPSFTTGINAASTTMALFNTTATTVNFAGAATNGNFGYDGTAASTTRLSTGATVSGSTKTVDIGTGGASGSTTNIDIGSDTAGALGTTFINSPTILMATALSPATGAKVGIGTLEPASIVGGTDVSPVLSIGGSDLNLVVGDKAGSLSFMTADSSYSATYADGVTGEIASISESATGAAYGLAFYTGTITGTNRGERLRITSSGNLRLFNTAGTFYSELANQPTANRTLTIPDVAGTVGVIQSAATAGYFDTSATTPTGTTRLNYGGYLYPTALNLIGQAETATAATHYFVETGSDGFVRPKTLANVQTEIVTSTVLGSGTANSSTYLSGDRTWKTVSGAVGGGTDTVFFENSQVVTTNYTITNGKNAMSAGPITINSGVTVTIGDGEVWTIV